MLVFFYELYTQPGYLVIHEESKPYSPTIEVKKRSGILLSQLMFEGKTAELCIAIMSATGQNHN